MKKIILSVFTVLMLVTVTSVFAAPAADNCRGVLVNGGTLILNNGAEISSNGGRGITITENGVLEMYDGAIITDNNGGGINIGSGTATIRGGTISRNTGNNGGGIYVSGGSVTIQGGTISENRANNSGGGIAMGGGTVNMTGGVIAGNTVTSQSGEGGGIYINGGTFTKRSGGIIYGFDAGANANSAPGGGHAIRRSHTPGLRNTTLNRNDSISTTADSGWAR
jgi:hypothetical protein